MEYNFDNGNSPENERSVRDRWILVIFELYFVLWIATAIYALIAEKIAEITLVDELLHSIDISILTTSVVAIVIFSLIMLWVLNRMDKNAVKVSFFLAVLSAAIAFMKSSVVLIVRSYCSIILSLILLRKEWFRLPQQIFTETLRVYLKSKLLILVMLLFNALAIAVAAFGYYIHECISHIAHVPDVNLLYLFESINAIGTIWVTLTVYNFALAVLCGTMASNSSQKKSGIFVVWRCIRLTCRYNFGTVVYASSIFAFLQELRIVLVYLIKRFIFEGGGNFETIFIVVYNMIDPIIFWILTYGGLTMSIAKGKGFYEGAKLAFDYFEEKPYRGLLVSKLTDFLIQVITVFTVISVAVSFHVLYILVEEEQEMKNPALYVIFHYSVPWLLIVLPLLATLYVGVHATLICFLEGLSTHNERSQASLRPAFFFEPPPSWYQILCFADVE